MVRVRVWVHLKEPSPNKDHNGTNQKRKCMDQSGLILSRLALSGYYVLPCLVLSSSIFVLAVSCRVLSCLVVSCRVLPCTAIWLGSRQRGWTGRNLLRKDVRNHLKYRSVTKKGVVLG
jgi:hypothetical protein